MKKIKITSLFAAVAFLIITTMPAGAQSQEEMNAWQGFMTPGDAHKMMAKWDGNWTEELTMWTEPGAEPTKSTATIVNKMILGGRYQESKHTGSFMGMPFEGQSITGYDNGRKIFVSIWIDNMGTGIMQMEGPWDPATKTMTLKGKTTDPMTGQPMDVRETFTIIDDNTQKMEMYMTVNGQEMKMMEALMKRKK